MKKDITAIIVDDELNACENLKAILNKYCPFFKILTFAQTTREAEQQIKTLKPDLVFLDIEIPNESGIEFIKRVWPVDFEIVFVTAYDHYALKTFKLNALDYILKPIDIEYLIASSNRIRETIHEKREGLIDDISTSLRLEYYTKELEKDYIILRNCGTYEVINFENIIYLKADGSYSTFIVQGQKSTKKIVTTYNLAYYENVLPTDFIRCHRSFLVNPDKVITLNSVGDEKKLILTNDDEVPVSRRRLSLVKTVLK